MACDYASQITGHLRSSQVTGLGLDVNYPRVIALGFQLGNLLFPLQQLLSTRIEFSCQCCKLLQRVITRQLVGLA